MVAFDLFTDYSNVSSGSNIALVKFRASVEQIRTFTKVSTFFFKCLLYRSWFHILGHHNLFLSISPFSARIHLVYYKRTPESNNRLHYRYRFMEKCVASWQSKKEKTENIKNKKEMAICRIAIVIISFSTLTGQRKQSCL